MSAPEIGPDIEFLDKVMTQVKAVAEEPFFDHERGAWLTWNQGDWHVAGWYVPKLKVVFDADLDEVEDQHADTACGTAFCFAGWAAELDPDVEWLEGAGHSCSDDQGQLSYTDGTGISHVENWAQDRLGLTDVQAALLFDAGNSLEDLQDYVTRLKDGDDLLTDIGEAAQNGSLIQCGSLMRGLIHSESGGSWEVTEDDGDTISIAWHAPTEEEDED